MTKDTARKILQSWLTAQQLRGNTFLPVVDQIIYTEKHDIVWEDWTFIGLLKVAYNLTDK